jgi:FkbM family methyltransferase
LLHRVWKPWFVYQPARLIRRAVFGLRPSPRGYTPLQTSWGVPIIADASRTIGRSIATTGVFDLAVSEALARLISPGDTVVDAGANVGYMTVLASVAAGPGGRVLAFEPHPALFAVAQRNVQAAAARTRVADTKLFQVALSDQTGAGALEIPQDFDANDGTARISAVPAAGATTVPVALETLDHALGATMVAVLKLDVEGFEPHVLRGAARTLAERRIRHIVFEDHDIASSEVVRLLRQAGYQLFSLGWFMRGLQVQAVEVGSLATRYEAPSFIATLEPGEVVARCRPAGWRVLRNRLGLRPG